MFNGNSSNARSLFWSMIACGVFMCILFLYFNIDMNVTFKQTSYNTDPFNDFIYTIYDQVNSTVVSAVGLDNLLESVSNTPIQHEYYLQIAPHLYKRGSIIPIPVIIPNQQYPYIPNYSYTLSLMWMSDIFLLIAPFIVGMIMPNRYAYLIMTIALLIWIILYIAVFYPKLHLYDMMITELMPRGAMACAIKNMTNSICQSPDVHCTSVYNCMETLVCNPKYDCQSLWHIKVIYFQQDIIYSRFWLIVAYPFVMISLGIIGNILRYVWQDTMIRQQGYTQLYDNPSRHFF